MIVISNYYIETVSYIHIDIIFGKMPKVLDGVECLVTKTKGKIEVSEEEGVVI